MNQMFRNKNDLDANSLPAKRRGLFSHFREDFLASIVVFLVALPLCTGIAVAVGVSPARAIITGIIGGLIVGYLAGAPLQVSGPAAGLFVIVADLIASNRARYLAERGTLSPESAAGLEAQAVEFAMLALGAAVLIGGLLQIGAGLLRLGQWFRAASPAVIQGMLAGIGVLILVSQFHVMLDHKALWGDAPAHGGIQYIATIPEALWKAVTLSGERAHHLAAGIGVLTIAIVLGWQSLAPGRLRLVPAPLVAISAATAATAVMNLPIERILLPESFFSEITLPDMRSLGLLVDPSILMAGLAMAIIASAETLLCATAIDKLQTGTRTHYDRELIAQGVGNSMCGLLGALPMTGVIVRSKANVQAGARTRLSAMLHGAWLLIFVALLPSLLACVPKASLGALLVYTGWKLINPEEIRQLWRVGRAEVGIYAATLLVIVLEDLLVGVMVGIVLSAAKLLYQFTHLHASLKVSPDGRNACMRLRGAATFIRLPLLAARLETVPAGARLHVDLRDLEYVDHACLDLLMSWAETHKAQGGSLILDWNSLHARFNRGAVRRGKPGGEAPAAIPQPQEATASR